jgi:hypothetical protein
MLSGSTAVPTALHSERARARACNNAIMRAKKGEWEKYLDGSKSASVAPTTRFLAIDAANTNLMQSMRGRDARSN